ncbi:hypothetical protein [Paludisphaera borealis]|nr:hypothetical protein [Paludisphaera borealis]
MTRRKWMLLIGAVALLAVGFEVVVWMNHGSRAAVEVVNDGDTTLENLVVGFGETKIALGDVGAGDSARVWLDGDRKGAVTLAFTQNRNPLTGFFLDDVDLRQLSEENLKLVIHVLPNQVMRNIEDGEAEPTPLARLWRRFVEIIKSELSYRR